MKTSPSLDVHILNPDKTMYKGPATAITAHNDQGKFDILVQHSHFISIIKDTLTIQLPDKEKKSFDNIHGVLRCVDNQVTIYLGI